MKSPLEFSSRFDRGGRPSVREMLADLVFNPADGTIQFRDSRLIMQRASVSFRLRKEVIDALGPAEARVFLMRLGFQSGRDDARFVRTSWPNLDTGDAFTAGTRLHMFGGVVQVETVHNDFDFRKKRFSGEFLWHDSVEASDPRLHAPHSPEPVCWTQVGYASGYASEFFDTLIVYKELACSAQGHKCCRVIGKPADLWGHDDPEVVVFRDRIAPLAAPTRVRPMAEPPTGRHQTALLAPVLALLDKAATHDLPLLFSGPCGSGRLAAAQYLHVVTRAEGSTPLILSAENLSPQDLSDAMVVRPRAARKGAAPPILILNRIETMGRVTQDRFLTLLRSPEANLMPRVVALTMLTPQQLSLDGRLQEAIWYRLSVGTIQFAALSQRRADIPQIATDLIATLARRLGHPPPKLTEDACKYLTGQRWKANLHELESVLLAALLAHPAGTELTEKELAPKHVPPADEDPGHHPDARLSAWLEDAIAGGGLSISKVEAQIYASALAHTDGNLSAAARLVGLTRAQFAYRIQQNKP